MLGAEKIDINMKLRSRKTNEGPLQSTQQGYVQGNGIA
jgi:hypothetical protein